MAAIEVNNQVAEVPAPAGGAAQPLGSRIREWICEHCEVMCALLTLILQLVGIAMQPPQCDKHLYRNKGYYIFLCVVSASNVVIKVVAFGRKLRDGYRGIGWIIAEVIAVFGLISSLTGSIVVTVDKYKEVKEKFNFPVAAVASQATATALAVFKPTVPSPTIRATLNHAQLGAVQITGRYIGGVLVFVVAD